MFDTKSELSFDDFKKRALDKSLSSYEKIGFPESLRKNYTKYILSDISNKLHLDKENKLVFDIGCGCGPLVNGIIELSVNFNHKLYLIDSKEMLAQIDDHNNVVKKPGYFASDKQFVKKFENKVDSIIVYSVIQYVFFESNLFEFLHDAISLLKPGGRLLIGDIPNFQKRQRFLNSEEGKKFKEKLKDFDKDTFKTIVVHQNNEIKIDDSIVLAILQRARNFGCESYLLEQNSSLPFANRREDILIIKR